MKLVVFLFAFISSSLAQYLAIYTPSEGAQYALNEIVDFQWGPESGTSDGFAQTIDIDLVYGDADNAQLMTNIVSSLPASSTSYQWQVPNTVPSRNDYFLKFSEIASDGDRRYSYSSRFAVTGTSATGGTSSVESTSPTNSTSSASKLTVAIGVVILPIILI